jgi:Tfp pilus assembly protein PilO
MKLPSLAQMSRRERAMAITGMAVVGLVLIDRVILAPWWYHLHALERDIQTLEGEIRTQHTLLSRTGDVVGVLDEYGRYLRTAGNTETELASLIREVQALGAKSGVTLGAITPQETTLADPYQVFALEVQYEGRLQQAVHFLHLLEGSTMVFKIERATWEHEDKDVDQLQGTLRLTSAAMDPAAMPLVKPAEASAS